MTVLERLILEVVHDANCTNDRLGSIELVYNRLNRTVPRSRVRDAMSDLHDYFYLEWCRINYEYYYFATDKSRKLLENTEEQ